MKQNRKGIRPWSWLSSELGFRSLIQTLPFAQGRLLDVGCGAKPYRLLFGSVTQNYIGVDRFVIGGDGKLPDVIADGQRLPFASGSFDTVLCTEVLEHLPEPWTALAEMNRVLRPAGYLILSAPQNYWLHEEPRDFYRFTRYGLRYLLGITGFRVVFIVPKGDVFAFGTDFSFKLLRGGIGILNRVMRRLWAGWRGDLAETRLVRWAFLWPQWLILRLWAGPQRLRADGWNGGPVSLREKFTLGHTVVAVKEST